MKMNEISTKVLYTDDDLQLQVIENSKRQTIEFKDEETSIIVPSEQIHALAEIIPDNTDRLLYLTYLINKALSNYNYSRYGYLSDINDKFQLINLNKNGKPVTNSADTMSDEESISAEFFCQVFERILEEENDKIEEIIRIFEDLRDYEIVDLFNSEDVEEVVDFILNRIDEMTLLDENEELADDYYESRHALALNGIKF